MSDDARPNLAAALAKVQAELPELERDRTVEVRQKNGDTYSYSYATLANLSKAALPLLAKHGLAFTALPGAGSDGKMCVRYHLLHESGESLSGEFPISGEGGIQMIGGRITYARRYCLAAIVGVAADEDDDARIDAASKPGMRSVAAPRKQATARQSEEPDLESEPADQRAAEGITKPQLTKLAILLKEKGFTERTRALAWIGKEARRRVESTKDLTRDEASRVIEALTNLPMEPDLDDTGGADPVGDPSLDPAEA